MRAGLGMNNMQTVQKDRREKSACRRDAQDLRHTALHAIDRCTVEQTCWKALFHMPSASLLALKHHARDVPPHPKIARGRTCGFA